MSLMGVGSVFLLLRYAFELFQAGPSDVVVCSLFVPEGCSMFSLIA